MKAMHLLLKSFQSHSTCEIHFEGPGSQIAYHKLFAMTLCNHEPLSLLQKHTQYDLNQPIMFHYHLICVGCLA